MDYRKGGPLLIAGGRLRLLGPADRRRTSCDQPIRPSRSRRTLSSIDTMRSQVVPNGRPTAIAPPNGCTGAKVDTAGAEHWDDLRRGALVELDHGEVLDGRVGQSEHTTGSLDRIDTDRSTADTRRRRSVLRRKFPRAWRTRPAFGNRCSASDSERWRSRCVRLCDRCGRRDVVSGSLAAHTQAE